MSRFVLALDQSTTSSRAIVFDRRGRAVATALGAAYLAGLAVGFWKDRAEIARLWSADRTFRARTPAAAARRLLAEWHRAVARAKSTGSH